MESTKMTLFVTQGFPENSYHWKHVSEAFTTGLPTKSALDTGSRYLDDSALAARLPDSPGPDSL